MDRVALFKAAGADSQEWLTMFAMSRYQISISFQLWTHVFTDPDSFNDITRACTVEKKEYSIFLSLIKTPSGD